ncbi:beta-ketoacyl-[acyl-carrier-protein] synthase family protein [Streptococcus mutans]|uniref:beta-ketoacyl-[acyl-carrier-protein] synthase family protein n=1 Tax=Streptococcus mutans TaxID=1309 RepID=UPI00145595FD|nr:beta-ketoacyl-[acyl-carrier-protein] synthase family protein [Streptococcus mutans]NLQ47927.1 beta-ketoacyl-[acyl-carrier-protein] synthase family protein [Streptococcus mutans]
MNDKKRVVITGFGTINALGGNSQEYWENSLSGNSGLQSNNLFEIPDNMSKVNGFVSFDESILPEIVQVEDRSVQLAFLACEEAIKLSGLNSKDLSSDRVNVTLASAIGNITTMENILHSIVNENSGLKLNEKREYDKWANYFQFNHLSKFISNYYGILGESVVIATGCTGGLDAIGYSFESIRRGEADIVITGSSEAPITPLVVSSFSKINATSTKFNDTPELASRPFDKDRDGFVLSEGSGIIILESLDHALSRGAKIYGEVVGYGSCNNAQHMTDIPSDGESIAKSIKLALQDAKTHPSKIDYINLHGSSTPQNDRAETEALKRVFGDEYNHIPVTSNKSQIGHSLSASNSIEIINCILSINTKFLSPTINIFNLDKNCDLNIVQKSYELDSLNYILKNASGFSGIHSAIIIGKYDE